MKGACWQISTDQVEMNHSGVSVLTLSSDSWNGVIICLIFGSELVKIEGARLSLSQVSGATRSTTALDSSWSLQRSDGAAGRRRWPAYSWKMRRRSSRSLGVLTWGGRQEAGGPKEWERGRQNVQHQGKQEWTHAHAPREMFSGGGVLEDKVSEIQEQLK